METTADTSAPSTRLSNKKTPISYTLGFYIYSTWPTHTEIEADDNLLGYFDGKAAKDPRKTYEQSAEYREAYRCGFAERCAV